MSCKLLITFSVVDKSSVLVLFVLRVRANLFLPAGLRCRPQPQRWHDRYMTHLQTTKSDNRVAGRNDVPVKEKKAADFAASKMQKDISECFMRQKIHPACIQSSLIRNAEWKPNSFRLRRKSYWLPLFHQICEGFKKNHCKFNIMMPCKIYIPFQIWNHIIMAHTDQTYFLEEPRTNFCTWFQHMFTPCLVSQHLFLLIMESVWLRRLLWFLLSFKILSCISYALL